MKLAPLQLEAYFLTDLNCQANPEYKADQETKFLEKDLEVTPAVQPVKGTSRRWQVSLNVRLQPAPEANSPYSLNLNLIGFVWVAPELPEDKLKAILATNGPSMLYGVAREMARDLTARGPFPPLLLPSVSFLPEAQPALAPKDVSAGSQPRPTPEAAAAEGEKRREPPAG
jgi:preprotein translocase subunit SecB